jgi:hypothetical protein
MGRIYLPAINQGGMCVSTSLYSSGEIHNPNRQDFESSFIPREYLDQYFTGGVDDEDRFTAAFIAEALSCMPDHLLAHEFGGGPTLYSVAALAAKAREIHFSDVVQANLDEVEHWRSGGADAFDWKPYIRLALESEGSPADDPAVQLREDEMRRRLTRLMLCDAQLPAPLGDTSLHYDLLAAHHCTDVAATSAAEWFQVLKNVTTLVSPGGWLLVTVTTGTKIYTVGNTNFRCTDLTEEDFRNGFTQAGYEPETLQIKTHMVEGNREYTGIIAAVGRRPFEG